MIIATRTAPVPDACGDAAGDAFGDVSGDAFGDAAGDAPAGAGDAAGEAAAVTAAAGDVPGVASVVCAIGSCRTARRCVRGAIAQITPAMRTKAIRIGTARAGRRRLRLRAIERLYWRFSESVPADKAR